MRDAQMCWTNYFTLLHTHIMFLHKHAELSKQLCINWIHVHREDILAKCIYFCNYHNLYMTTHFSVNDQTVWDAIGPDPTLSVEIDKPVIRANSPRGHTCNILQFPCSKTGNTTIFLSLWLQITAYFLLRNWHPYSCWHPFLSFFPFLDWKNMPFSLFFSILGQTYVGSWPPGLIAVGVWSLGEKSPQKSSVATEIKKNVNAIDSNLE